jgi:hypothetical protein
MQAREGLSFLKGMARQLKADQLPALVQPIYDCRQPTIYGACSYAAGQHYHPDL